MHLLSNENKWGGKVILKVLSSEMDPVEIEFIWQAVMKEWGAEISGRIRPSPIMWEPLKAIDSARPFIHYIQLLATVLWTMLLLWRCRSTVGCRRHGLNCRSSDYRYQDKVVIPLDRYRDHQFTDNLGWGLCCIRHMLPPYGVACTVSKLTL